MSDHQISNKYGSNPAEVYERCFVPAIGRPLAEDLVREADLRPGERVLDVACGTGIVAKLAAKKVDTTGSVSGLDVVPEMLTVARATTADDTSITYYSASAEAMPLPDGAFDVVLCQMGLQFFENRVVALKEMRRVLAPGGRLLFNLPGPRAEAFAILADAMERNIGSRAAAFVNHVFSLYDPGDIGAMMSAAGLEDTSVKASRKTLHLPPPQDFLWQYVHSTPLSQVVSAADERSRSNLEKEVIEKWRGFAENGAMTYEQAMVTASALRRANGIN
ncbi:methyltransferase domain-containing protein [Salinispira pacifica]